MEASVDKRAIFMDIVGISRLDQKLCIFIPTYTYTIGENILFFFDKIWKLVSSQNMTVLEGGRGKKTM